MTTTFALSSKVAVLSNGVRMPRVGLGTWQMKGNDCYESVLHALKTGYKLIDTASVYENEQEIAKALMEFKKISPTLTDDLGAGNEYGIFITSKAKPSEIGEKETYAACLASLKRLGIPKLDLYLLHWPGSSAVAANSPENRKVRHGAWKAMERLYNEGKCRAIGVSNYLTNHLDQLIEDGVSIKPMVDQLEYHPLCQNEELLNWAAKNQMQVQAYSSLGIGNLQLLNHPTVLEVSKNTGKTPAHVLLRWGLQKNLCVIPKSKTKERIEDNFDLYSFQLNDANMQKLSNILSKQRFCWDPNTIC